MNKRHRIFIAINLPNDIKKYLAGFEKKLSEIPAKWAPAENLHITLVFLGDLTDQELGQVCMAVKEVSLNHDSFNINLNKIGYGPVDKSLPRYIWVGGEKSIELSQLKKDLENAFLEVVNFTKDNKSFSPHITLARVNTWQWRTIEPEERQEVNETIDLFFTVESIEIMESELGRGGPKYQIIESFPLK